MGDMRHVGNLIVPGITLSVGVLVLALVLQRVGVRALGRKEGLPPGEFIEGVRDSRSAFAAVAIVVGVLILVVVGIVLLPRP
jgi:cytochrome b561